MEVRSELERGSERMWRGQLARTMKVKVRWKGEGRVGRGEESGARRVGRGGESGKG